MCTINWSSYTYYQIISCHLPHSMMLWKNHSQARTGTAIQLQPILYISKLFNIVSTLHHWTFCVTILTLYFAYIHQTLRVTWAPCLTHKYIETLKKFSSIHSPPSSKSRMGLLAQIQCPPSTNLVLWAKVRPNKLHNSCGSLTHTLKFSQQL